MSATGIWRIPPGSLQLPEGDVHLWRLDLDQDVSCLADLEEALAPLERRNAAAFRHHADRVHYSMTRGALRNVLARYLNTQPAQVALRRGLHGKPELANGELRFNVSHTHGLALFAISSAHEVGVDVELIRPGLEEDIAGWFLSLRAIRLLESFPKTARRQAFFRGWTRMEAYSKASGEELTAGLENFEHFLRRSRSVCFQETAWWLHDFFPRRGYVGTVAVRARTCRRIRYWKWSSSVAHASA
jgi:4'-phosphopantetheinyl transferase